LKYDDAVHRLARFGPDLHVDQRVRVDEGGLQRRHERQRRDREPAQEPSEGSCGRGLGGARAGAMEGRHEAEVSSGGSDVETRSSIQR
jgi:hypothetical protein